MKRLTVVFGLAQIAVGVLGQGLDKSVVSAVLAVQGFTVGIILGVFLLGLLPSRIDQRSALAGLAGGLVLTSAVVFGTELAWPWFALVGATATTAVGLLASRVTSRRA